MGLRATLLLLPATCAALATAPALASPQLEVRAVTGAQAPDAPPGLDFLYFGDAVVNDAGEIAFLGFVSDGVENGGMGVFGPASDGQPTAIAFDFGPVPGIPDAEFGFASTYTLRLDSAGEVVFRADLNGSAIDPLESSGIWRWNADTGLALAVRSGEAIPGGAELTLAPLPLALYQPTLGPTGDIDLWSYLNDPSGPANAPANLIVGASGITPIAIGGTPVPGVPGATFSFAYSALVSPLGDRFFAAMFAGPGVGDEVNNTGVFHWSPTAGLSLRFRAGDPAPGMPAGVVFLGPGIAYPTRPGGCAYVANLAGPDVADGNDTALYGTDGEGSVVLLAREGDPVPGTATGTVFGELAGFSPSIVTNTSGRFAFLAPLVSPVAGEQYGIWSFEPASGTLALRAHTGDPAPELPGLALRYLSSPLLNERGDLAFSASLSGPGVGPENDLAIFALEGGTHPVKVAREGDLLAFGPAGPHPIAVLSLAGGSLADAPGGASLSDAGHLVFGAFAADGINALVVATLPEPGALGLIVAIACLVLLPRRA